jgi:hypothetical protein
MTRCDTFCIDEPHDTTLNGASFVVVPRLELGGRLGTAHVVLNEKRVRQLMVAINGWCTMVRILIDHTPRILGNRT